MSEDTPESMKDISATSFGYLIAFVLPGIFGLYALSTWSPQVEVLLQPILQANASVGPSFVFLVIAIGVGVCLSALRFFIFEKALYHRRCLSDELYAGMTGDRLAIHRAIVEEHYRYHQFYGNCAVALIILFFGWLWRSHSNLSWSQIAGWSIGFVVFFVLLERSAWDTFSKYIKKCNKIPAA
jgi:uncharacterized membrane protein (DUF106 family)